MRSTVALSITLPHKMAAMVRKRVESGEYATESEVIREGLRALSDKEDSYENWIRSEVRKSVEEFRADPWSATPLKKVAERYGISVPRTRKKSVSTRPQAKLAARK